MNVSKVCGLFPFDGRSDTDNSMVNVFSGECKSESESRIVTVKVKVKLNMVKVTLTISLWTFSAESESSSLNCRGNLGLLKEGRSI